MKHELQEMEAYKKVYQQYSLSRANVKIAETKDNYAKEGNDGKQNEEKVSYRSNNFTYIIRQKHFYQYFVFISIKNLHSFCCLYLENNQSTRFLCPCGLCLHSNQNFVFTNLLNYFFLKIKKYKCEDFPSFCHIWS